MSFARVVTLAGMTTTAPPPPPPGALSGLQVLEMGALIAGPFCAKMLGEFGADVVKIEPPGQGDPLRKWRYLKDGTSVWWHVAVAQQALGHASTCASPRARRSRATLAARADILVENFRPGTLEGWGLGYEDARRAPTPGSSWSGSPVTARPGPTARGRASA